MKELGAGDFLRARKRDPATLASKLVKVTEPQVVEAAARLAQHFKGQDGLQNAADLLERHWRRRQ
jgi:UDP:flavonoid glycosyltransferase YjiC (YdhE family)